VTPDLKWPNDLLVGPRKLAGVLAESVVEAGTAAVVVGIGLNLRWTAPPPADVAARAITLSEAAGRTVSRDALLRAFLAALGPLVDEWQTAPDKLLARYRAALATLGRRVRVETAGGALVGTARDVADDGALLVEAEDGAVHTLHAGDVVHLHDHGSAGSPR
jgi:BirA family biotin operon repressor/biotin-[acetyl-CoA-carboxylase] ligase